MDGTNYTVTVPYMMGTVCVPTYIYCLQVIQSQYFNKSTRTLYRQYEVSSYSYTFPLFRHI